MEQAINAYYTITASPEFRERERLREKARHDEAQALYHAEQVGMEKGLQKGRQEEQYAIARNLLNLGLPLDQIAAATKVPVSESEQLRRGRV